MTIILRSLISFLFVSMALALPSGSDELYWKSWRDSELAKVPALALLNAPLTPFHNDSTRTLNLDAVPNLAKKAFEMNNNFIWVGGGMGQFYSLSTSERNTLLETWVKQANASTLPDGTKPYIVAHVGTTVLSDAVAMAKYAKEIGADAVASVPPYYETPSTIDQIIEFLKPIAEAAHPLPLFYYHIPGSTGVNIQVQDLLNESKSKLPSLLGIKYVDTSTHDWFDCVRLYNDTHVLLLAPEPKLQFFALGLGRGAVIAEDFFTPSFMRMWLHFVRGNLTAAHAEQQWRFDVEDVFSQYGGGLAKRAIYPKLSNTDLGPRRWPTSYFDDSNYNQLVDGLNKFNFFEQKPPKY